MQHNPMDFGLIFAGLETLLLQQTDMANSSAELFLKLFRQSDPSTPYSSEHALFRKIRSHTLNENNLIESCRSAGIDIDPEDLNNLADVAPKELGAWCIIYGFVKGFQRKINDEPEMSKYLDFILAHCQAERDLINIGWSSGEEECKAQVAQWLLVDLNTLNAIDALGRIKHITAILFYWAALFEKILQIEHGDFEWEKTENNGQSLLIKYLPKQSQKIDKLVNSTWRFIEVYKNKFVIKPAGVKVFDSDLYSAVYEARLSLQQNHSNFTKTKKEPDLESIERVFKKIKRGDAPLTIGFALENLIPLSGRTIPSDYQWDSSLMIIHFLNLFTKIQSEALNSGITSGVIVDVFDRYPKYVDAVDKRLQSYKRSGRLTAEFRDPLSKLAP